MAGLIQGAQEAQQPPVDGEPQGAFDAEEVKSKIQVPPDMKEPFERVLAAGLKVMYDEQTHQLAMEHMQGEGPTGQKLGEGVAGLLLLLFKESNNTLPPQLIIPAGVYFVADAADFLEQSGQPVSPQDIGLAMETMVGTIFKQAGMDPEKMYAMLDQMGLSESAEPAGASREPAVPAAPRKQPPLVDEPDEEAMGRMKQRSNKARRMKAERKGT